MPDQVLIAGAFVALMVLVVFAYRKGWQRKTGFRGKTLWDWLQLCGIPVSLALLAFFLTNAQSLREERHAADAEQENTLRTYFAQMSDLMLDRRLLRSKPGADVRRVARTATLTAVRRLDGPRRGLVVRFLAEARLLRRGKDGSSSK